MWCSLCQHIGLRSSTLPSVGGEADEQSRQLWTILVLSTCFIPRVELKKQMDGWEKLQEVKCGITTTAWTSAVMTTVQKTNMHRAPFISLALGSVALNNIFFYILCIVVFISCSVLSLSAQGYVCARQECMDPSVMSATRVSSASAALAASPASVTTVPATATHSLVSLLRTN